MTYKELLSQLQSLTEEQPDKFDAWIDECHPENPVSN